MINTGEYVEASLTDGTVPAADLLIGADGVHSQSVEPLTRKRPAARYVGLTNFRRHHGEQSPSPARWSRRPGTSSLGPRPSSAAHPTAAGDVVWFVNVPEPEITLTRRRTRPRRSGFAHYSFLFNATPVRRQS